MMDMYDKVRKHEEKQHDKSLTAITVGVSAVIILIAIMIIWLVSYHARFNYFVIDLSNSTNYAYNNDCLRAEVNGDALRISGDNGYKLYTYISVSGSGRERSHAPEGDPVTLDYGDGSCLELWDVPPKNEAKVKAHGLFVCYTGADGASYSYVSSEMNLDAVIARYLSPEKNSLCEE